VLAITTLFAVARLVVPRSGYPSLPGVLGFALVTVLCLGMMAMLYRPAAVRAYLVQPPNRLVFTREGIRWRPATSARRVPGWRLTARVAVLSYGPLMAVAAVVAVGAVFDGRPWVLPVALVWLGLALVIAYVSGFITLFLLRGKAWVQIVLTLI